MPRAPKRSCVCGCGQAPAATTRNRLARCEACEATIRTSRAEFALGLHGCRCGAGVLMPVCLEDRCILPGAYGETAWAEYAHRFPSRPDPVFSERARRAARTRKTRAEWAAVRVASDPIPF